MADDEAMPSLPSLPSSRAWRAWRLRWLLWAAALAVALVYVRFYAVPCASPAMLQSTLEAFRPELLLEKQPLVLSDPVRDHDDLRRTALRYQFVTSDPPRPVPAQVTHTARARLTMLYFHQGGEAGAPTPSTCAIDIVHPGRAGVRVILPVHQTLLLPPHWRFTSDAPPCGLTQVRLHDPVSWLACRLLFR
jgi:hypothetical protein